MRTLKFLLIIVVVSLVSCKKDNGSKLPVIKGIQKRDINAQPTGTEGSPNTNIKRSGTSIMDDLYIMPIPNPATTQLNLYIRSDKATEARIWMVKGRYKPGKFGPNDILGIGMHIPIDQIVQLKAGTNVVTLNLASANKGYYRLYVEYDSDKLWDNVKVE